MGLNTAIKSIHISQCVVYRCYMTLSNILYISELFTNTCVLSRRYQRESRCCLMLNRSLLLALAVKPIVAAVSAAAVGSARAIDCAAAIVWLAPVISIRAVVVEAHSAPLSIISPCPFQRQRDGGPPWVVTYHSPHAKCVRPEASAHALHVAIVADMPLPRFTITAYSGTEPR